MVRLSVQDQAGRGLTKGTVKLPEPIYNTLPRLIESALKLDATPSARSIAINVFASLIGCVPGRGEWNRMPPVLT
jgi:hypothetical protein